MIEARGVHMVFNQGTPLENHAVRGVDLQVDKGAFITLIGSNGSGKSTFLRMLSGEQPVSEGQIFIDGDDVTEWPHHRRAQHVAQVFQDPLAGSCAELTIEENMALAVMRQRPRRLRLAVSAKRRQKFADQISTLGLGLENRLTDLVGLLSGGQRQALSLLMCTLAPSKVLLLDEHTAALDPRMSEFVLELTEKLYQVQELTVIMVTHSLHDSLSIGDRTIMMHHGNIELDLSGDERAATDAGVLFQTFARLHA